MEWLILTIAGVALLFGFVAFVGAPYVPVRRQDLRKAFDDVYALSDKDLLVDLGSGDGKVLREASRRGARSVGYELNPLLVCITRMLSLGDKNVKVLMANFWTKQLPDEVTVVYMFTVSRDVKRLATKLQAEADRLQRPLYALSYGFQLKGHEPVKHDDLHYLYKFIPLQPNKPQV